MEQPTSVTDSEVNAFRIAFAQRDDEAPGEPILAARPHSVHHVRPGRPGEGELEDEIPGVILAIPIESPDPVAARGAKAGGKGGGLAVGAVQLEEAVRWGEGENFAGGGVARAVVDPDRLPGEVRVLHGVPDLRGEPADVCRLIAHRDNQRDAGVDGEGQKCRRLAHGLRVL